MRKEPFIRWGNFNVNETFDGNHSSNIKKRKLIMCRVKYMRSVLDLTRLAGSLSRRDLLHRNDCVSGRFPQMPQRSGNCLRDRPGDDAEEGGPPKVGFPHLAPPFFPNYKSRDLFRARVADILSSLRFFTLRENDVLPFSPSHEMH